MKMELPAPGNSGIKEPSVVVKGAWLLFYLVCSSTMLVVNKLAMKYFPYANLNLILQVWTCNCLFLFDKAKPR